MNENSGTESKERERESYKNLSNEELIKKLKEKELQIKKLIGGGFMAAKVHNELFDIPPEERDQDEIKDGYQLKFVGKNYAKLQAGLKTETIITPDTAHNSKPENTNSENIFITGDNLDVLKHLENAYSGKVDVIYIDPPYNTGSDGFVYADNFKFSDEDLHEKMGLSTDEISRVRALSGKSSHPAWLTFMLPRLMIAKRLLSDTGVIFISIDDNEQAQLKMLCDEIFGERSFIQNFLWLTGKGKKDTWSRTTEQYILVYAKNKLLVPAWTTEEDPKGNFENPDNDPRGPWFSGSISFDEKRSNIERDTFFTIESPSGKKWTRQWQVETKQQMIDLLNDNRIYFGPAPNFSSVPRKKIFPFDKNIVIPSNLLKSFGTSKSAIKEVSDLFNGTIVFDTPKPVALLKHILKIASKKDSLILDFFAGSATTADAVMQLNKEDSGNRKYILVQLPEKVSKNSEAEKAGYETIDQISRERIERAATKIGDNSGFKYFNLTTPNDENALLKLEEFDPNAIVAFPEDMTTTFDGGEKAILQTWLIDDGFEFNQTPKIVEFAGYQAHYIEQRLYLISTGWSSEATRELLNTIGKNKLAVQSIVIFPYSFTFNELNELKINLRTAFEKSNKIELLERY